MRTFSKLSEFAVTCGTNPLHTKDDFLIKLNKMNMFSKIDLSEAYFQIPLDEESKKMLVINTPFALFQYKRLPFAIASPPAIFQRYMESILSDVPNCVMFLDDVLISGASFDDYLISLELVLQRLQDNGLICSVQKCDFFVKEVTYLGHILSSK
ncbi:Retrovirus-related Pol polyprotein from transposon 17.6 [Thelohanellus kitauei]|uniref:Retrovirus-related Pol polyprotein from transposon 17.6 n=1 Tax=Thelohanellus kitauei TaxID=669202 RepID=A0A0C2N9F9_THEKT|nr:Retrovirus-related Pol polyprotein from transposon 17.6 [Thelohanellus kitauei]